MTPSGNPNDSDTLTAVMRDDLRAVLRGSGVRGGATSRERIMASVLTAVRTEPLPRRETGARGLVAWWRGTRADAPSQWRRRGVWAGVPGMLASTVVALVMSMRMGEQMVRLSAMPQAMIVGDSVVPALSVTEEHWLDTVRVVELRFPAQAPDTSALRTADGGRISWNPPTHARSVTTVSSGSGNTPAATSSTWTGRVLVPREAVAITLASHGAPLPAVTLESAAH